MQKFFLNKLLASCAIMAMGMAFIAVPEAKAEAEATAPESASQEKMMEQKQAQPMADITTGESVYNAAGEEVGAIEAIAIGSDGKQHAVVSVGEFLGIGGKEVLLPVDHLSAREEGGYTTALNSEALSQLPEYPGAAE